MIKNYQIKLDNFLKSLYQSHILDWAKKLSQEFPKAEVYLVGGAVRDAILGLGDNKDYDFVVRGVPMAKLEQFLSRLGWVEKIGRRFGVLKFKPQKFSQDKNFEPLDIALPRSEFSLGSGAYKDFKVKFDKDLAIEKDLLRRDFTINAIALRLFADVETRRGASLQNISDPFHGLADIKNKIIRAVGNPSKRLQEDYTRILRAIRLSSQLNFKIESKTREAIKKLAPRLNDKNNAGEWIAPREVIAKELLKSLYFNAINTWNLLEQLNLFKVLMPEMLKMKKCPQPANFHSEGDVWVHTKLALSKIESQQFKRFEKKLMALFGGEKLRNSARGGSASGGKEIEKLRENKKDFLELILGIMFHDLGKPLTIATPEHDSTDRIRFHNHDNVGADLASQICTRLALSAPENFGINPDNISWMIRKHMMLIHGHPSEFRPITIEKYFFSEKYPGKNLIKLAYLDSLATIPKKGPLEFDLIGALLKRIKNMRALVNTKKAQAVLPPPLLTGREIMRLLKIPAGPRVGALKEKIRAAQLSGRIKNKPQAKKYLVNSNK